MLGVKADAHALEHTAHRTGLRGRWERLSVGGRELICDIGHNPPALARNFAQLRSLGRPLTIVYGIMADKALEDIAPLMPSEAEYILCAPAGSRALPADKLHSRLKELRPELKTRIAGSVALAVEEALRCSEIESIIYIGGSTFVVAEAIALSNRK